MNQAVNVSRDKLAEDFRTVVADAELLVKATAQDGGEKVKALRAQLEYNLQAARTRLVEVEQVAVARAKQAAAATDRFAHENPWKTAGVAAGIGLLVGLLIGRRI